MVIRRLTQAVQLLAVVAFAVFLVGLFLNEPTLLPVAEPVATAPQPADTTAPGAAGGADAPPATDAATTTVAPPAVDAPAVFGSRCSSCHGATGGGGIGPALSGGAVAAKFPSIEDQIAVVTDGRGRMPAFGSRLTEDEIRAVVQFTRTL